MKTGTTLKKARGFLSLLRKDESGNVLAMVAAGIFPLIAMAGGAADMSRAYMTRARMQQACDAGALAARRSMSTGTLKPENIAVGREFFDFNFPSGSYGSTLISRTYVQPVVNSVTLTVVKGQAEATVPTMLMQVFGKEEIEIEVTCTSKQDVANADVAMVLDVTNSMDANMPIGGGSSGSEKRIVALRKSVKAFYNSLGSGRAGGDASKGRIRYAFIPYATSVNSAYLLTNNQMVNNWVYQSRLAVARNYWGWIETGTETFSSYSSWTPNTDQPQSLMVANYNIFGTVAGTGPVTITNADGSTSSLAKTISGSPESCIDANTLAPGIASVSHSFGSASGETQTSVNVPVRGTDTTRNRTYSQSRMNDPRAYRYAWTGSPAACRLQSATHRTAARWSQTRGRTSTRPLSWTNYVGAELVYGAVNTNVSVVKAGGSNWNKTFTLPLSISNPTNYNNIVLSGTTTSRNFTLGTAVNNTVSFLGCMEDRTTDTSINGSTSLASIPSGAIDLDVTRLADTANDNTRWRPYLHNMVFHTNSSSMSDSSITQDCPSPALKLAEYATYKGNISTTYPDLFSNSGSITSIYYPRQSNALLNAPTLENYIDRIGLAHGTLHDIGFIWGMHLLSGQGMFASENPDLLNNIPVNRHIVFMTDGELRPGQDRYVYSGYNIFDGRLAPSNTSHENMKPVQNRRLRILCEEAKRQGITVWVVVISDVPQDYDDVQACASGPEYFKTANNSTELINSFTTIAQSIGGLRISE